jgi:hypothetical protein
MLKNQIPVGQSRDPLEGLLLPVLNFIRWTSILGTLIFGIVTIWFFVTAHRRVSGVFLIVAILFGIVWRIVTQRLKSPN